MKTGKTAALMIVIALAGGVTLVGCGQMAESATEKLIEEAAGGDVNIDVEGDGVTIEGEDGGFAVGGDLSLPENWPAEIPTYGGGSLVMVSVDSASGGATAVWSTDESVDDAAASIRGAVEGAGYAIDSESQMEGLRAFSATGNGYRLDVSVGGSDGATSVNLLATKE